MSFPDYRTYDANIGPGGVHTITAMGNVLSCLEASGPVAVKFNEGGEAHIEKGLTISPDTMFERIDLVNKADHPISVRLALGMGEVRDSRLALTGRVAVRETMPDVLKTTYAYLEGPFSTKISPENVNRREIIIANRDQEDKVYVGGRYVSDREGLLLLPGQSMVLQSSAEIWAVGEHSSHPTHVTMAEIEWGA